MAHHTLTRIGATILLAAALPSAAFATSTAAPTLATATEQARDYPHVSADTINAHTSKIARITSEHGNHRQFGTAGLKETTDYVAKVLADQGWTVQRQEFTHNGTTGTNLVVRMESTAEPGMEPREYVIGAHLDTAGTPGANNNAAGVALLIELARAASTYTIREHSVTFVVWGAGAAADTSGVKHYVDTLTPSHRRNTRGYIDLQGVGAVNGGTYFTAHGGTGHGDLAAALELGLTSDGAPAASKPYPDTGIAGVFRSAGFDAEIVHGGGLAVAEDEDAALWDVEVGKPHDPCFRTACDTIENVSSARAAALGESVNALVRSVGGVDTIGDPLYQFSLHPAEARTSNGGTVRSTLSIRTALADPKRARLEIDAPDDIEATLSASSWQRGDDPVVLTVTGDRELRNSWRTVTVTAQISGDDHGVSVDKEYFDVYFGSEPAEEPAPVCRVYKEANAPITDFRSTTSTLTVTGCPGSARAQSFLTPTIEHSYRGDLDGWLRAPSGRWYRVFDRSGGDADNVTDTFRLDLSGETANGDWTFLVRDRGPGDSGTLVGWWLTVGDTP